MNETHSKVVCTWIHLVDHATLDHGGKAILIGIFDRIAAGRVPVTHPMCHLAVELDGPPKESVRVRVQIQRPGGGSLNDNSIDGRFSEGGRMNLLIAMPNLQLPDFGQYTVLVSAGPEVIKAHKFHVDRAGQVGH